MASQLVGLEKIINTHVAVLASVSVTPMKSLNVLMTAHGAKRSFVNLL